MSNPLRAIAEFMEISARTAPKTGGIDFLETEVLKEGGISDLADEMIKYGEERGKKNFDRDAENVRNSDAVLLLSLDEPEVCHLDCGACGFSKCENFKVRADKGIIDSESEADETESEFEGPICAWRLLDLGIALGSAVKTASLFNADNRIMYRAGVVARKMNLIDGEIVLAIPIAAEGKNIYFDR